MTKCRECGKEVSSKAFKCPHCGVATPDKHTARVQTWAGGIALVVLVAAGVALWRGLSGPGDAGAAAAEPAVAAGATATGATTAAMPAAGAAALPGDLHYTVLSDTTKRLIKRSVVVRLSRRANTAELRALAHVVRAQDTQRYERTFILYYLPAMHVGAGAWASTHFNPDLEVRVLGLSVEDAARLAALPPPADAQVLGRWFDDRPGMGQMATLLERAGTFALLETDANGGHGEAPLTRQQTAQGERFDFVDDDGVYVARAADGTLQLAATDGLIATLAPVEE